MKAEELMIGDWVLQCELNVPVKVQSIMCHYDENIYFYHETREYISNVSKLEPIPLIAEILEKNGFVSTEDPYNHKKYFLLGKMNIIVMYIGMVQLFCLLKKIMNQLHIHTYVMLNMSMNFNI